MRLHRLLPLAVAIILLGTHADLAAANYYVAPEGNDANSGTALDRPFRYIQTAIKLSAPGDTIYLMPGTHTVRPGDKNIGFKEKGGKPGQPITVTTTAPGVIIDLKDAAIGWGGFRIGNDAEWIVIDGGGTPDPFDESTYRLVIQNAAYQANAGAQRSDTNCRPITIQSSNNIVIRNILGRRSMGSIGCFGATQNILIENCRCVPGEKPMDPAVSHGIYVGSGADNVTIRHCFIKWGGDDRLGLQNNGGGKKVLIEDSYITECDAAIKSFNGGHVTARNCFFYNLVEKVPMQGEVTAEKVSLTPPSTAEKAPPSAAILAARATSGSKVARPEPPPPPSAERLAEIAAYREKAQHQIVQRLAAGEPVDMDLPFKGQLQSMTLTAASADTGIVAKCRGSKIVVAWADLTNANLAGILETILPAADSPAAGLGYSILAVLYSAEGNAIASANMSSKALELDPALNEPLKTALRNLR